VVDRAVETLNKQGEFVILNDEIISKVYLKKMHEEVEDLIESSGV